MKKSAILMGAEVTVKVPYAGTADQIRGTITAVDSTTITITEKLDEKSEKEPRVVKIPKASAEALAFHKNPNIPEADVEDGVLTVNGEVVRTGFEVADVLTSLANRVYVTAKVDGSDRVDVYSYNVAKDEFYKVTNVPLALVEAEKPTQIGTSVIIPYLNKHEEEEEIAKEDGTKEKVPYEVLEETGYLLISTESTMASVVKTELGNSPMRDSKSLGNNAAYFVTTTTLTTEGAASLAHEYDCDDEDDYDDYDDDDYDLEDRDYGCNCRYVSNSGRIVPVKDDKIVIRVYRVEGRHLVQAGAVEMDGEYVSAIVAGRTAVIKTTKAIHVDVAGRIYEITDKLAIKALDGYDYVVKNETKNGVLKIWFANKDAELKVYSVTPAEDARGPIIEVQ